MSIERIIKIKNHRIFSGFIWPENLLDFEKKNLFYGWNGTGKSTLSNLFRSIEKRTQISEGEVEFVISGSRIYGAEIETTQGLPNVRVFNKDFIADNVFTDTGSVTPILFLGKENIEKQKKIEQLRDYIEQAEREGLEKEKEKNQCEKNFDRFKQEQAKSIKDLLSSSGGNNPYNNYDKRLYRMKCAELLNLSDAEKKIKILNEEDFNAAKEKKDSKSMDEVEIIRLGYPDTQRVTNQIVALLKKTVASKVIDTLKKNPELSTWVKSGLEKHKNKYSNNCLFCEQPLPVGRIQQLEAHFNNEYNTFIADIKRLSQELESKIESLESFRLPPQLALYENLRKKFDDRSKYLSKEIDRIKEYLKTLLVALKDKEQQPFNSIERSFDVLTGNANVISNLNEVINKHNKETETFQSSICSARTALEESQVAETLEEYKQKKEKIDLVVYNLRISADKISKLKNEIHKIEADIEEHRRPAYALNSDIRSYLGRDEITFKIKDNGYQINRNGNPATNLSEGEKTAIAFLYFLKSLEDKSFSLENGIVVIDDPVSSLDSNSLFHAFGFMKYRTESAGQLFILTHSYSFFRQVKNWFNHLKNQKKRFYMLTTCVKSGNRSSSISKLDSLLRKYESEYHYLFSLVYKAAHSETETDLQQNYHLPNIARRLLESFLEFRQPSKSGELWQQLKCIDFDEAKKTSILRFLHTHSHSVHNDSEQDLLILTETKTVLKDLLELIKKNDHKHFEQMEILVKKRS